MEEARREAAAAAARDAGPERGQFTSDVRGRRPERIRHLMILWHMPVVRCRLRTAASD